LYEKLSLVVARPPLSGVLPDHAERLEGAAHPFEAVGEILGPRQPAGLLFCELGSTPEAIYEKLTACWRYAAKRSRVDARLHDLRHTFGSALRRTMSKEDVASTMGISGAIARTYLDHESADLTRRAFAKPGTNSARSAGVAGSETSQG
jgi:hypothetical protein